MHESTVDHSCEPVPSTVLKDSHPRKRKTHTKSRKGCGNCKLRRVKCDEAKPECQKCVSYGVNCNYDGTGFDELKLPGEGAIIFSTIPATNGPSTRQDLIKDSMSPENDDDNILIDSLLGMPLKLHNDEGYYRVTKEDVEIIRRFKDRTVFTIGTAHSVLIYRREVVQMVASNASHLAHIVLRLTLLHDRCISTDDCRSTTSSAKEAFHMYHGSAILNKLLSQPIRDEDKDALWGSAALMGAITIATTEATTPEESWPLRADEAGDLDWLRMSDGKKEVWKLVDPLRPESIWKEALDYETQKDPDPYNHVIPELELLYPYLIKIYDFEAEPRQDKDDPYHTAASILVRLLELDCNHSTIMYFLSFLGHMDPRFRQLLHVKDPKALLLLSWWYGKMMQYNVWWMAPRMKLEGQAICMYLEKHHADQPNVVRLLDYPKMMTGLVAS